jgi:hypothetical protein
MRAESMLVSLAVALALTCPLAADSATQPPTQPQAQPEIQPPAQPQPQQQQPQQQPAHWLQRLGVRSAQVQHVVPLIDRVVLVPDAATYVDELRKWSPRGRWPVLIEDDWLTPMFVRRFAPRELIRRESASTVAPLPEDPAALRHALEGVVVSAVGGNPQTQSIIEVFAQQKYPPPGVVVASTADPAWTAAVALAAGHFQPLLWIDGDLGPINGELDDAAARKLASEIDQAIEATKYTFRALGDDIDTITLCRSAPVAARVGLAANLRPAVKNEYSDGPVALTDFLGRNEDGSRYAVTGWIFGDEKRAAYMAMCSLFLQRENMLLLNTYALEGDWKHYSTAPAAELLARAGFKIDNREGDPQLAEAAWRRMLIAGLTTDLVIMNSSGYFDFFSLAGNVAARPGDVPVLNHPVALHLIHSWSLHVPARSNTVGGRWLDHGVYAMTGSCYEPFLSAFIPPHALAGRMASLMPMLPASRRMAEDGMDFPWRVVTIGDPLMLVPPPAAPRPVQGPRIAAEAGYGVNLLDELKTFMKRAAEEGRVDDFVQSMRILDMLGRDGLTIQMWKLSQQKDLASGRVAAAALPALFRSRDADGFIAAWGEGGPRTPVMLDMLWHLMLSRVGAGMADAEALTQLQASIRPDAPAYDVELLAPLLMRAYGRDHAKQFITRELEKATDPEQQRVIREVLGRY